MSFTLRLDDATASALKLDAQSHMRNPTQHAIFLLRLALSPLSASTQTQSHIASIKPAEAHFATTSINMRNIRREPQE